MDGRRLILGVETSTRMGALAVTDDGGNLVAETRFSLNLTHSETLMPNVSDILGTAGLQVSDLSAIAVAIGPGSFTGLRVALATVKGLAFSTGIPIYPVSTLRALAFQVSHASIPVCPILESRKHEVYAALYRPSGGGLETILNECAIATQDLLSRLEGSVLFLGDACRRYRDPITKHFGARAYFAPWSVSYPSAVSVIELAFETYIRSAIPAPDPTSLSPAYLKPSEAETKWKERSTERK